MAKQRLDEHATFRGIRFLDGKYTRGEFRLSRCVGDLGYAHALMVTGTDAEGNDILVPLSAIRNLEA